jgi:chromosome partitioning protein
MIIAIANPSGGQARTSVASHLAQLRARRGCRVKLLDVDAPGVPGAVNGRTLPDELESLRHRYHDIVIDTGGDDTFESRAALIAARLVVVPVAPGQPGQQQLANRLDTARMFNPGLRVLYAAIGDAADPTPAEIDDLYREIFPH